MRTVVPRPGSGRMTNWPWTDCTRGRNSRLIRRRSASSAWRILRERIPNICSSRWRSAKVRSSNSACRQLLLGRPVPESSRAAHPNCIAVPRSLRPGTSSCATIVSPRRSPWMPGESTTSPLLAWLAMWLAISETAEVIRFRPGSSKPRSTAKSRAFIRTFTMSAAELIPTCNSLLNIT
jgi:hypothetical protein